jgi:hypothetical protein
MQARHYAFLLLFECCSHPQMQHSLQMQVICCPKRLQAGCMCTAFKRGGSVPSLRAVRVSYRVTRLERRSQTAALRSHLLHLKHSSQALLGACALPAALIASTHCIQQHRCVTCCLLCCCAAPQVVHTLTGHTNAVSCVSCSPLDEGLAVSAGEDRCLKVRRWLQHDSMYMKEM